MNPESVFTPKPECRTCLAYEVCGLKVKRGGARCTLFYDMLEKGKLPGVCLAQTVCAYADDCKSAPAGLCCKVSAANIAIGVLRELTGIPVNPDNPTPKADDTDGPIKNRTLAEKRKKEDEMNHPLYVVLADGSYTWIKGGIVQYAKR